MDLKRSPVKTRFARNFLRALQKLNDDDAAAAAGNPNSLPYSAGQTRYGRYRKIKLAAYASMASAVGTRQAWSRALLWRIRTRAAVRRVQPKRSNRGRPAGSRRLRKEVRGGHRRFESDNVKDLRKLVPGGKGVDFGCLLDETAHYIKCLTSQVEIMRNIADLFSA